MAYAALSDWRTKEVPNKYWLYAIIGVTFTVIESVFFLNTQQIILEALSITFTVILGSMFFYSNMWGGADAKALITLGVSAPLFPIWSPLRNTNLLFSMFPFIVMFISSIIAVAYTFTHKSNVPLKQRKLKFLPFMFIATVICVII
jgi:preflagellin peptidase FlaK